MHRAVYHGSDLVMLDDVLSAVDAQVACWILSNAILSPLMKQKTCILCTHNIQVMIVCVGVPHRLELVISPEYMLEPQLPFLVNGSFG